MFPAWVFEVKNNLGPWLAQLMEPNEPFGRFRHAPRSQVGANIASSSYVVGLYRYMGMLQPTGSQLDDWADWFQSFQDPSTGQFIDETLESNLPSISQHGRSAVWNHRRYTTKQAQSALLQLGRLPLHPVQEEQLGFDAQSQSIVDHLQSFDWERNPWAGGSAAANSLATLDFLVRRGQKQHVPVLSHGIRWLEEQQDPQTGLWGDAGCAHRLRINAALKVITRLYSTFRRPLQYPEKVIDSVLANWHDQDYFQADNSQLNACDEMNTLIIAAIALRFTDHRRGEVADGAARRIEWFKIFRRRDGIFSLTPTGSLRKLNDIPMTQGEDQGDIHGVNLICNALAVIAEILDQTDELGWRFHGFHYGDWLTIAGGYEPDWEVVDSDTYAPRGATAGA